MADAGMAAFSVFFMQSPSFLAHQQRLQQGAAQLEKTCRDMQCDPLIERVAKSSRSASRLPVEAASEAEVAAWEKSR